MNKCDLNFLFSLRCMRYNIISIIVVVKIIRYLGEVFIINFYIIIIIE